MNSLHRSAGYIASAGSKRLSSETWSQPVTHWLSAMRTTRANGLLVAPSSVTDRLVDALRPVLREPLLERWEGTPWDARRGLASLVLHDVITLRPQEQLSLFAWIDGEGRGCRIIALSPLPVFPLVRDDGFLAPLYYRLNCVYVEHLN